MNDMAVWHANLNNSILTMHKIWQIAQESDIFLHNLMVYFQICYFIDLDAQEHQKNHNDFLAKS